MRWHPLFVPLAAEAALVWLAWGLARDTLRRVAPRLAVGTGLLLLVVWLVRFASGTLPA